MLPIQMLPQVLIVLVVVLAVGAWLLFAVVLPRRRQLKAEQERERDAELERQIAGYERRRKQEEGRS